MPEPGVTLQSETALVDTHPIPFGSWTKLSDDRIAVHFETGSPECYGIQASAAETSSTVTITLRTGIKHAAVGKMCPALAVFATVEVPLHAPLADRSVRSAV